jgi:hypothetical protein
MASRTIIGLAIALTFFGASGASQAFDYADIEGKWCGDNVIYTFTPDQMIVAFYDNTPARYYKVNKYENAADRIRVHWLRDGKELTTGFADFGNKQMAQLPNTAGDMGPRRNFRRC